MPNEEHHNVLTCLGLEWFMVKYTHSCSFTASTSCGRNCKREREREIIESQSSKYNRQIQLQWHTHYLLQIRGFKVFFTGRPFPMGALTKSKKSLSGWQEYKFAAFAVSITDPPPTAKNPSNWFFRLNEIASSKLHVDINGNTFCGYNTV